MFQFASCGFPVSFSFQGTDPLGEFVQFVQAQHVSVPLFYWLGWNQSRPGCTRFLDRSKGHAVACKCYMIGNLDVPVNAAPGSQQAIPAYPGAAGDPAESGNGRMSANVHIVGDLHEVIDPDVVFQHGVFYGAAVNGGIRSDFTIITDYATQLGYFLPVVPGKSDAVHQPPTRRRGE
jgi:hypothetical protein